ALNEPATARASAPALQPFETPGENFPGSAFYYLAPDSGVVAVATGQAPREPTAPLDAMLGDSIARPTFLAGTAQDRLRALQCLTAAVYYEAATEPDAGQRAVAQVVLNRVAHPAWPNSVCGVVYQGSERPGCQFSFACDGSMARAPARIWWLRARDVAEAALAGEVYAPVGLATHYHTGAVHPAWADRLAPVGAIGAHLFYRPRGAGGAPGAFADAYRGGEPIPAPHPRAVTAFVPRDPLAAYVEARGYAASRPAAVAAPNAAAAPVDTLPAASGIRPEYRNSGRWIVQPKG
ncbi:MAG TPA: cell wall hydrolase, partial [Novosphingobium sp.]|nr:cell wall hydrolase [Novosphingobium sp.]